MIDLNPWSQFFDLGGSEAKPFGVIKNIKLSNIKVKSTKFGEMQGNPLDQVSDFSFQNVEVTTPNPMLKNKYEDVKFENVVVNGKAIVH